MTDERAVPVRCPCCGEETITALMYWEDTEGLHPGWELDDFDPGCECHDYMDRLPMPRKNGVLHDAAGAKYREDIRDRALGAL